MLADGDGCLAGEAGLGVAERPPRIDDVVWGVTDGRPSDEFVASGWSRGAVVGIEDPSGIRAALRF